MTGSEAIGEDALLGGRVRLLQMKDGYRAAIDPVLLAAAIPAKSGERVLDLGAGVGAASLCLAARVPGVKVMGLDIQPALVQLATENAVLNKCDEDVAFVTGDLLDCTNGLPEGTFDHVMANPPYLDSDSGNRPPNAAKAIANIEGEADLVDWVQAAVRAVRRKGSVTFIHRGDRIDELLAAFHGKLGEIVIFPLWPGQGKAAKRVILTARKGVASPARISAGLVLHEEQGKFSKAANAILKDSAPLFLT
ncbi:MAG: methyltransferase [Rhodospirillales bacterium]|nr:methyltransferase [Rhodospirillales bacterium]